MDKDEKRISDQYDAELIEALRAGSELLWQKHPDGFWLHTRFSQQAVRLEELADKLAADFNSED